MGAMQTTWRAIATRAIALWRLARAATGTSADRAGRAGAQVMLGATATLKVSVVIPALNEATRIAQVVAYALSDPATAEVIVVDDSSIDDTAQLAAAAGARVITSTMLGKGRSMRDGLLVAAHDLVAYLDGDLAGLRPRIISDLAAPLLEDRADFVKASFGRGSGRVTELTAKPMLKLFFPELSEFTQPLGGIIAARKSLLQTLTFEDGYGVDVGLLIDTHRAGARLLQVEIGALEHESQSLKNLSLMAQEVGRVIFDRAKQAGRLSVEQILSVYEIERQNQADIDCVLDKLKGHDKLVLLTVDGAVSEGGAYLREIAQATGRGDKLDALIDTAPLDMVSRGQAIAQLFRFVHKREFENAANAVIIRPEVIETVNWLRRLGYAVGVIGEGYFVAAEIIRRRIFADVALSNTMQFEGDVCQGEMRINRAFAPTPSNPQPGHSMSNALRYIRDNTRDASLQHIIVVGGRADGALLQEADYAFALEALPTTVDASRGVITLKHFSEIKAYVQMIESERHADAALA
jgi:glucosyl-3-phosphoglycerate synthase